MKNGAWHTTLKTFELLLAGLKLECFHLSNSGLGVHINEGEKYRKNQYCTFFSG